MQEGNSYKMQCQNALGIEREPATQSGCIWASVHSEKNINMLQIHDDERLGISSHPSVFLSVVSS